MSRLCFRTLAHTRGAYPAKTFTRVSIVGLISSPDNGPPSLPFWPIRDRHAPLSFVYARPTGVLRIRAIRRVSGKGTPKEDRWTRSLPIRDAISTRGWSVEFLFRPGRGTGYSALSTRYPTDLGFRENFATHGGEPGCWRIDPSSYPAGLNYFFKEISSRYFGENRSTIGRRRRTATTRPRLHRHFFSFPLQLFCRRG